MRRPRATFPGRQLERWNVEQNFVASVALGFGALFGARGVGGRMQDLERRRRYGERRQRTRRKRMATAVLREAAGLAEENTSVLGAAERAECLAVLERWLPPRPDTPVAVRAEAVQLSFGPIHALTGADVEVPAGQMVGLIGPNSAGKTTLFDVISGFQTPDSGRVELFGRDVTATSSWERSRLGMTRTFQNTRVVPELTAGDNILGGASASVRASTASFVAGRPSAWAKLRAAEEAGYAAARLLDVHLYWDERVGTLEFSARRRIEIARALVGGPRLLLLDEPAAGLDPASSSAMFSLIRRLHTDLGLSVLLVKRYVKAVLDSCDLVYVLAEGRVLAAGHAGGDRGEYRRAAALPRHPARLPRGPDAGARAVRPEAAVILGVQDLIAGYGGQPVLHKVTLEVRAGEVVSLLGANGAGKSTLLKTIIGTVPVIGGYIRLAGTGISTCRRTSGWPPASGSHPKDDGSSPISPPRRTC